MTKLAIKGHPTRGKEIIKILEMLGGKNKAYLNGTDTYLVYYICTEEYIDTLYAVSNAYIVFTLEEFLEKFPYKVGDRVSILDGTEYVYTIKSMTWDAELEVVTYKLKSIDEIEDEFCWFADELLYYTEHKEEHMEVKGTLVEIDLTREESKAEEIEVILGNYEFVLKNGKTYFVKKKPNYPKTYDECCRIVNANSCIRLVYNLSDGQKYSYDADNLQHYENIRKLIICRDAYWKIAGNWKPDIIDGDLYCIGYNGNVITWEMQGGCRFLVFPTEEMRDAFYENFKELIEECKEFF